MSRIVDLAAGRTLAVLGLAALAGCPSARPGGPGDASDGATFERTAAVAFAAPDLPPQFLCFLGFRAAADGSAQGDPVAARGPWGVPDPADPNAAAVFGPIGTQNVSVKLVSGFPYGAMVKLGIRKRDAPFFDQLAGLLLVTSQVDSLAYAGDGVDSTTCRDAWAAAQGQPGPRVTTRPGQIQVGQSWLVGISGCAQASADPQCAGGANLTASVLQLDLGTPGAFAGSGDTRLAIQVADLSPFAGYQDVDVYLQPMRAGAAVDGGAAPVADGAPLLLGNALSWTGLTGAGAGVALPGADLDLTLLVIAQHGTAPFCGGQPGCSTTTAFPVKPFMDRYGPTARAAWSGHQTFVLFGRPPLTPAENPADFLRLGVFSSSL